MMPGGRQMKARTLQVHGEQMNEAHQGQRCAMNLQGIDVAEIERGDVVARPGTLFPSRRWLGRVTCLPSAPLPIRQRTEAHFHHGARECAARIVFRDREELAPGQTAIAEFHFPQPMAGVFGDHFVLRSHSPLRTIAGGVLIDPMPAILRKRDPAFAEKFTILSKLGDLAEAGTSDPETLLKCSLSLRKLPGATEKQLAALSGLPAQSLKQGLAALETAGEATCWDAESGGWIGKKAFESCLENCRLRAKALHEREPLKGFFAHNAFCSGWGENLPPKFTQKVIATAIARGILKEEANGLKLAGHEYALDKKQAEILARLESAYEENAYAPPTLKEACEILGKEQRLLLPLLTHLCETGKLVKIQEGLYYNKAALEKILKDTKSWLQEQGNLDIAAMKSMFGVSRKYAVPLLEYMDAVKMTVRVGNERKLLQKAGG